MKMCPEDFYQQYKEIHIENNFSKYMDDVIFIYVNFSAAEILEKYGVNMTITAIRDSQVFI